ncbi:MAG: alpha-hydroxy-acid oxidizing protein [Acidimicrobiia bacterium]|nr:alpha-hydroxy-acid oxidizing protein [Acidimicrobiia bacterium]
MTRRHALREFARFAAASPLLALPPQANPAKLEEMINVFDFDPIAKSKLAKPNYEYVTGGSWDEWTLKRNRTEFDKIILLPRFMRRVDKLDLSITLFGEKLDMPILVAPTGTHTMVHPDGELATVRGAGAAGAAMVVSTSSSYPLAKIAAEANRPLWFQLYTGPDLDGTRDRVENARALGCKAICLTVDAPYHAPRERDARNNLVRTFGEAKAGPRRRRYSEEAATSPFGLPMRFQATLDWSFVDQLCAYAKLPVLLKGILTPEDAVLAAQHGAAGVIVSNHGGRYLDGAPSTIEMLPSIVDAVEGRIPVLIDSGFRRGTDILKALAIGATAVLVGRPPLWGLGAFGQDGVQRVMEILRNELAWAMGLAGRSTIASLDRTLLRY